MNYVFMSVEFIYICRMKPIIKKILAGPLWVMSLLPLSCSKQESSIEQCLKRAEAEYQIRNLSEAMDAAIQAIDKADACGADSLKAAGLCLASRIAMMNMEDSLSWDYAERAHDIAISANLPFLRCQALIIKGQLCDYACISEENDRNEEGLKYLQNAIEIAKSHNFYSETAQAYYVSADILINMNRWNGSNLDHDIYDRAREFIAVGDALLESHPESVAPNISVHIRHFRQGARYHEAIEYCKSEIQAASGTDYLTLFQVYDHLTQLQSIVGDLEGASDSHIQCTYYTQLYMKQSAENRITQMKEKYEAQLQDRTIHRRGIWLSVLLVLLTVSIVMLILLLHRSRMLKSREEDLTKALIQRNKLLAIARSSVDRDVNADKAEKVMAEDLQIPLTKLTPRELEIAHLAGQGLMNKEIATILSISPQTVGVHKNNLYRKLGVGNNIELLRFLQEVGL